MQFRALTDFRAEFGIRLSELAEKLEIPYNELEQIENLGTVPANIAEKIIAYYGLGNTYFTENIGASPKMPKIKTTPKNPFAYFCKVYFVYTLISTFILSVFPFSASLTTLFEIIFRKEFDFTLPSPMIATVFVCVVEICGCILLSKYILKHTTFTGNINKYKYIAFILPSALLKPLNIISNFASSKSFEPYTDEFSTSMDFNPLWFSTYAAMLILISIFGILLYALINNIAIETDSEKQDKTMNIVCICTVVSQIVYVALYFILAFATKQSIGLLSAVRTVIYPCIYTLIAVGILLKNKIGSKLDTVWYTALPIVSFVLPIVFTAISSFTK